MGAPLPTANGSKDLAARLGPLLQRTSISSKAISSAAGQSMTTAASHVSDAQVAGRERTIGGQYSGL